MAPIKLILLVALVFGAIALAMLAVPRMQKRRYKRAQHWNNTRPKHDLSRVETSDQPRD